MTARKFINPFSVDYSPEEAARKLSGKQLAEYHFGNPRGIFLARWQPLSDRLIAFGRGYHAYGDTGFLYKELSRLASYDRSRVSKSELSTILLMIDRTISKGEAFLEREQGEEAEQ